MDLTKKYEVFGDFKSMALLTAGTMDDYNTMTIGWGELGTLWGKPVCTVYVRPTRYTLEYMDKNDTFTVSFYDSNKEDLVYLGRHSGRDEDKVAKTQLTPVEAGGSVSFEEAWETLVLKKLYRQQMDESAFPADVIEKFYSGEDEHNVHYMFVGEVVDVIH